MKHRKTQQRIRTLAIKLHEPDCDQYKLLTHTHNLLLSLMIDGLPQ